MPIVQEPINGVTNSAFNLGDFLAQLDQRENRLRTSHGSRLKELATQGMARRGEINEGLSSQGMIHSGANLDAQSKLGGQIDSYRAETEQDFADRLADIARQRLSAEGSFRIGSLIPR